MRTKSAKLTAKKRRTGKSTERCGKTDARQSRPTTLPTIERLAKPDAPVKTDIGHHRIDDVLTRMYRRRSLDLHLRMNLAMHDAGQRYQQLVEAAGLSGLSAVTIGDTVGGRGDPAYMMPRSEAVMRARLRVRAAWGLMGSRVAHVVHGILVEGAAAERLGLDIYGRKRDQVVAALTTLRIGLWTLANANWA